VKPSKRAVWLLALTLSVSITLTQQKWVGELSIYAPERWAIREVIHEAILHNRLPDSVTTWASLGANGANIRLLTVVAAEGVHRLTGMTVHRSYLAIETAALLLCCLLLFAFLEPYTGWAFALAGLLYWGSILPLTYIYHHFHPWDKPSIATWLLALICARNRWWWSLAGVLMVGVATKYDIIVFPLLVFQAYRKSDPLPVNVRRTALLFVVTFSTYLLLRWLVPDGFEPRSLVEQFQANMIALRETRYIMYPPLLALGLPLGLAIIGYSTADEFARACLQLMAVVGIILALLTNFVEFRAEVPMFLLMLPAAWFGLKRIANVRSPVVA
jgi:hypothetical protein